jgi:parallel beta-helix repeat protein
MILNASGCTIENCTVDSNAYGIALVVTGTTSAANNVIRDNTISNSTAIGIGIMGNYTDADRSVRSLP